MTMCLISIGLCPIQAAISPSVQQPWLPVFTHSKAVCGVMRSLPHRLLTLSGTSKATRSSLGIAQLRHLNPLRLGVHGYYHLGDPLTVVDREGLR